jgi:hypothetical protein
MSALAIALIVLGQAAADVPVYWTGARSIVTTPEISLITDEWPWMRIWLRHTGREMELKNWERVAQDRPNEVRYDHYNESGIPFVNFNTHAVVVIFSGRVHQTAGYTVMGSRRNEEKLTIRYTPNVYSVVSDPRKPNQFVDQPFLFILVSRSMKAVRLEKGIPVKGPDAVQRFEFVKELVMPRPRH